MKRILCIFLCLMLLTGCTVPAAQEADARSESAAHIIVTMPGFEASNLTGLPEVQAAVNAITIPEIGVEVEFQIVSAVSSGVEYPNSITMGKQMDLMVLNNENIQNYIAQEMILPLDDLLAAQGKEIQALSEEYLSLYQGAVLDGRVYGLRVPGTDSGECAALWINPALLEQVSFSYDSEKIYTFEELDGLFAQLKEAYPDSYPLGQITNNYSFSTAMFFVGLIADNLGGSDPGVLDLDSDSLRITDYYELDAYQNWLEYMRKWYLAGYIYPDSAITTATSIGLYKAGVVLSIPHIGRPYMLSEEGLGTPVVAVRLSPIREGRGGNTGIFWTIPVTSREPEAAMKFLNMMYTDERIVNLLSWGIQGRDYELDETQTVLPLESQSYSSALGLFGDQRLRYETYGQEIKEAQIEFASKAVPVNFAFSGFSFDTSDMVQEMLEIEKVKSQYVKLLEAGCVDLDTVYPEFLQKLYDAGLQRVMDEKQRQFDTWLEENQQAD